MAKREMRFESFPVSVLSLPRFGDASVSPKFSGSEYMGVLCRWVIISLISKNRELRNVGCIHVYRRTDWACRPFA